MDIFRLVVVLFSAILAEVVLTRIALRSVARVNLLRQSSEINLTTTDYGKITTLLISE